METHSLLQTPANWHHEGLVLPRNPNQDGIGEQVMGDPCIVWDETLPGWRMFLFADPPGHAQAICTTPEHIGAGCWKLLGPLTFTNPEAQVGEFLHKLFLVLDPHQPNHAARIGGRYCLLGVSLVDQHKWVQQAWSEQLSGPWTFADGPMLTPGSADAFDGKHIDTITGYYFAQRQEILYYYKGYPQHPQPWPTSPYASVQAAAVQAVGKTEVTKLGPILPPHPVSGHWGSGWVGGLQLLPGASLGSSHRWVGLLNASPTPPTPHDRTMAREEPAPSLGGFVWCDEEWPIQGWQWESEPLEWIEQLPLEALANGEGVNLWRHHLLILPAGRLALFYNSGIYGTEQLYLKIGHR